MRITKYEHATLRVQVDERTLVIDPGNLLQTLPAVTGVDAIVITHEHADHWTEEHVRRILASNPHAEVFGPRGVAAAVNGAFPITVVSPGETITAGPFELRFFGGKHAEIHRSIPIVDNVGVLVNNSLYYPGDSFVAPSGVDVEILAAPVGAPWLKIGEAIDFVLDVAPRHALAVHDAPLSAFGLDMGRARLAWATAQHGGTFHTLDAGESFAV